MAPTLIVFLAVAGEVTVVLACWKAPKLPAANTDTKSWFLQVYMSTE